MMHGQDGDVNENEFAQANDVFHKKKKENEKSDNLAN